MHHFVNTKGILSAKNGMNIFRGCTHGCIYCDSRSLCYNMPHDFEDIEVKENALVLLEDALKRKRHPCMIGTGAMTDPYIPLEYDLCYMQKALELIYRYGFGITVQTKSDRILRDLDMYAQINEKTRSVIQMTLTNYDDDLSKILEPNVCTTTRRAEVLKVFGGNGISTVAWLSPVLPFINDTAENISAIVDMCADAGVKGIICFGMGVTLREGNREYFYQNLDRLFPGMKERYIRTYGNGYVLNSPGNNELMALFIGKCEKYGIMHDAEMIFEYLRRFEDRSECEQMSLF